MKAYVIGAGSFGCVIANLLAYNKHQTYLWSYKSKEQLERTYENPYIKGAKLDKTINIIDSFNDIEDADIIVMVVPSFALRNTAGQINAKVKTPKNFVICTKGLEADTMKNGKDIITEEIKNLNNIAILSGPTHAEELAFNMYTTIVSTSKNIQYAKLVQEAFSTPFLRVYTNQDEKGVELLGAAKNVLAMAAGVCDAYPSIGDNAKAALITRGLRELKIIGEIEGCNPDTFYGLTGLGDLLVTAFSKHSRNRKFGELIGGGLTSEEAQKKVGMVVEGIYSVKALQQLNEKSNLNLPIIETIYKVLFKNMSIDEAIKSIYERQNRSEY